MKVIQRRFLVDGRKGEFVFDIYADTHYGTKAVAENLIKRHIKETKDNNRYWCHLGDKINGILPNDKRFDPENLPDWALRGMQKKKLIQCEYDYFYDHFSPIKDNCLFLLSGDGKHSALEYVANCQDDLLVNMGVEGGCIALLYVFKFERSKKLKDVSQMMIGFHHGWFAGRTKGNKDANLQRGLFYFPYCIAFFCGHGHDKHEVREDGITVDRNGKVIQVIRRAAMSGGYMRTYTQDLTEYSEIRGYPPTALGRITVTLRPFVSNDDEEKRIEITNR